MTAIPSHPAQSGKSAYILAYLIRLLSLARKVRKAGFLALLLAFLINCYLMLIDQHNHFMVSEFFTPDGKISDTYSTFLKLQGPVIYLCIAWMLATHQSLIDSLIRLSEASRQPDLHWRHKKAPYIIAYIIWLLISYIPFLFFDSKETRLLLKEDAFYEDSGFFWLFLTSISFFYLFFRRKQEHKVPGMKSRRNIFFLLLGLLFFVGAGEEISWGQRIFHFQTPEIMSSNLQHEFSLHNMPFLDPRVSTYKDENGQRITVHKTGIDYYLSVHHLFRYFWFSFCVLIPVLYIFSTGIRKWLNKISFPVVPIWVGLLFIINYQLYYQMIKPEVGSLYEVREASFSFLFLLLALWLINCQDQQQHHGRVSDKSD